MSVHVALLRAINVGGTGKLPMAELRRLCEDLGFAAVRTYIQSGNVVFEHRAPAPRVAKMLGAALEKKMGKPVGVLLRSAEEMQVMAAASPFPGATPSRVLVFFLEDVVDAAVVRGIVAPGGEQLVAKGREVWVHYPNGMGTSKLKLPFAAHGTARNLATVTALAKLASV